MYNIVIAHEALQTDLENEKGRALFGSMWICTKAYNRQKWDFLVKIVLTFGLSKI